MLICLDRIDVPEDYSKIVIEWSSIESLRTLPNGSLIRTRTADEFPVKESVQEILDKIDKLYEPIPVEAKPGSELRHL